jgi:hypothetical protein
MDRIFLVMLMIQKDIQVMVWLRGIMNRVGLAAVSSICLALAVVFAALPASATTYKLAYEGGSSGGSVQGYFLLDVEPAVYSAAAEERNTYSLNSTDYSFTLNGVTHSGQSASTGDAVSLIKSTNTANFFHAPFAALSIDLFGSGAPSLVLASVNPDPTIPLATLDTMPSTLAGWVAKYGSIFQPALRLDVGGSSQYVYLTSYQLGTVTATPIPAALPMLLTGLIGLGAATARRYRRERHGTRTSTHAAA